VSVLIQEQLKCDTYIFDCLCDLVEYISIALKVAFHRSHLHLRRLPHFIVLLVFEDEAQGGLNNDQVLQMTCGDQ